MSGYVQDDSVSAADVRQQVEKFCKAESLADRKFCEIFFPS